jgi:hypothetical protein
MKCLLRPKYILALLVVFEVVFFWNIRAEAHCDTMDGPVVATAKNALEAGNVGPLLKWVSKDDEQTIRTAFEKTMEVRKLSGEAKDLADMYFLETLVRIHRAGEGMPYTGVKPVEVVDPAVALADKALETGSVDKLANTLSHAMNRGIQDRFQRVLRSQKHADENVSAGREFVQDYVVFTHYVEGLHHQIKGGTEHDGH